MTMFSDRYYCLVYEKEEIPNQTMQLYVTNDVS